MLALPPLFNTLSLHDALPICLLMSDSEANPTKSKSEPSARASTTSANSSWPPTNSSTAAFHKIGRSRRSEEHTSELQSQSNLVCRLLLEKKNTMALRS